LSVKVWAASDDEAADTAVAVGAEELGFEAEGRIEIYDTEPMVPRRDEPFGYDARVTGYTE
jgi:hypothetical protein